MEIMIYNALAMLGLIAAGIILGCLHAKIEYKRYKKMNAQIRKEQLDMIHEKISNLSEDKAEIKALFERLALIVEHTSINCSWWYAALS